MTEEQGDNYINGERIDMELERAVGRVVRAFDPCISCKNEKRDHMNSF